MSLTAEQAALCARAATWPDPYTGEVIPGVQPELTIGGVVVPAGRVSRVRVPSARQRPIADVRAEECAAYQSATVERYLGELVAA